MSKIRLYGATSGYVDVAAPAVADDATLTLPTGASGFGKVLQVVQGTKTDTFTTSSTSFTPVTGLSVSITPVSVSNKVLLFASVNMQNAAAYPSFGVIARGGTPLLIGDTAGSRRSVTFGVRNSATPDRDPQNYSVMYLDSPATTSATTYTIEVATNNAAGTVVINRAGSDTDNNSRPRTASTLIAIEVAA